VIRVGLFIRQSIMAALQKRYFIVSFPKSGRTWVLNVLINYFSLLDERTGWGGALRGGVQGYYLDPPAKNNLPCRKSFPIFTHDCFGVTEDASYWPYLTLGKFTDKLIYLNRSPHKIFPSFVRHQIYNGRASLSDLSDKNWMQSNLFLSMIKFHEIWLRHLSGDNLFHLEDLIRNEEVYCQLITRVIGECDLNVLKQALAKVDHLASEQKLSGVSGKDIKRRLSVHEIPIPDWYSSDSFLQDVLLCYKNRFGENHKLFFSAEV